MFCRCEDILSDGKHPQLPDKYTGMSFLCNRIFPSCFKHAKCFEFTYVTMETEIWEEFVSIQSPCFTAAMGSNSIKIQYNMLYDKKMSYTCPCWAVCNIISYQIILHYIISHFVLYITSVCFIARFKSTNDFIKLEWVQIKRQQFWMLNMVLLMYFSYEYILFWQKFMNIFIGFLSKTIRYLSHIHCKLLMIEKFSLKRCCWNVFALSVLCRSR